MREKEERHNDRLEIAGPPHKQRKRDNHCETKCCRGRPRPPGGYMKKLGPTTVEAFKGRILNTHPALLPKFGGQGMYGDRVFEAVIEAGETESGVSIHIVDADIDTGRVVRQCKVPVFSDDSSETLKTRVRMREREFVVETLASIAQGTVALHEAG